MNVVDSSAWLEYLANGPNVDQFASAIEDVDALVVPAICIYEVFKRLSQQRGAEVATEGVSALLQAAVADLDAATAIEAARLSLAEHLPLADAVILATARKFGATLWTQDAHFRGLPDVQFFGKPGA